MNTPPAILLFIVRLKWQSLLKDLARPKTLLFSILVLGCVVIYAVGFAYLFDLAYAKNPPVPSYFIHKFFTAVALFFPLTLNIFPSVRSKRLLLDKPMPLSQAAFFACDVIYNLISRKIAVISLFFLLLFFMSLHFNQLQLLKYIICILAGFFFDQHFRFSFFYGYRYKISMLFLPAAMAIAFLLIPDNGPFGSMVPAALLVLAAASIYYFAFLGRTELQSAASISASGTQPGLTRLLLRSFYRRRKVLFPMVILVFFKAGMLAFLILARLKGKPTGNLNTYVFMLFETPILAFSYIMNNCWGYQPNLTRQLALSDSSLRTFLNYFLILLTPFLIIDILFFSALAFFYEFPVLNALVFFINAYLVCIMTGFYFSMVQARPLEKNDSIWSMRQQTPLTANIILMVVLSLLLWQLPNLAVMLAALAVSITTSMILMKKTTQNLSPAFIARFSQ